MSKIYNTTYMYVLIVLLIILPKKGEVNQSFINRIGTH